MRIERIRIEGFGALSDVDLAWPEDRLLLIVDPNESGKTTLCEAISAALYGLPRGKVGALRARELRRPRGGAPLRVGLDLTAEGKRYAVDRDLEAGTLRVMDRDRNEDVTKGFLRGGGRDVFGDEVTGLTEPLFRTTAYVAQNVLDEDELDSTLTTELARIADSGGGEASVVRALRVLQEVRTKMPDARSGASVSVETEILRLTRRVEERKGDVERLRLAREKAAEASTRLTKVTRERDAALSRAALAEISGVETERLELARRLAAIEEREKAREDLTKEAAALADDALAFSREALAVIDRLREERGTRPDALQKARAALEAEARAEEQERRERVRRLGPMAALDDPSRLRLASLLSAVVESSEESAVAEEALEAQWEELRREGLAEDLAKLDAIVGADREFLGVAEEVRSALELEGIQCDRRAAEASAQVAIALGERRERIKRAKGLMLVATPLLVLSVYLLVAGNRTPLALAVTAFSVGLALFSGVAWLRGSRHRLEDEQSLRLEESEVRKEAVKVRKSLSDVRLRLDRVAKFAGFADTLALLKSNRRARAAEEKRRKLVDREARRDTAVLRRKALERELEPFREALSCSVGLPSADDARRGTALLLDVEKAVRAEEAREAARSREKERLAVEEAELREVERSLRLALERCGIPGRLPLPEGLLAVESGRRRAQRRREIVDLELPAREGGEQPEDVRDLARRIAALDDEIRRRLETAEANRLELRLAETVEDARRLAEEARQAAREREEARQAAEKELALRAREGGEHAREAEEALEEAEADLERARLFRDALDLAREALSTAASAAYGDFKLGLSEASRSILASWDVPFEALEFADDLSVSVITRGGRLATKAEISSGFSTGAREQIRLTGRLAALRYLGTGTRGVPLLLDDPLVAADDERFVSVMRFLVSKVLSERPVLLASCHGWRHERLLERLSPDLRDRIAPVSLVRSRPV